MPKKAKELGPLQIRGLTNPGFYPVGGVAGLALQVLPTGGRSWVLRVQVGGRRRDMGLGGFPDVPLAEARESARRARDQVRQGVDPIEQARAARSLLKASQAAALTFEECAAGYIAAHRAGWRNEKHAQQWLNSLAQHAYPMLGELLVRDVALPQVLAVLQPIWTTTNETAVRVRGRIEAVLDWAAARGLRDGPNPARWRGHLDKLLPKPSKVSPREHHPALPIAAVGAFMVKLRTAEGMGARALEFTILTAARSGEVRGALWGEIDRAGKVWTIPGQRMKGGKEHRVPLSDCALAVLDALPASSRTADALVFPAARGGTLSDMTLSAVLRRLKVPAVPHGFRSTFRDWAAERTSYPSEVAEMALAHAIGDKVEAAYRRGNLFDKRRLMMTDWATFLAQAELPAVVEEPPSKRA